MISFAQYTNELAKIYPKVGKALAQNPELLFVNMISPFKLELPKKILRDARAFVEGLFDYRQRTAETHSIASQHPHLKTVKNSSILMALDFHINEQGDLKLIEVNTNASFYVMSTILYNTHNLKWLDGVEPLALLKESIYNEIKLVQGKAPLNPHIVIVDENPKEQRLYVEFLIYQELFQSWGWTCEIKDIAEVTKCDFVYNRSTDFYLEKPASQKLVGLLQNDVVVSPNPQEYFFLADKSKLHSLHAESALQKYTLASQKMTLENSQQLWSERKKWFFKPANSHGSKQSYRGGSVSKKAFEELLKIESIAQEFVPAPVKTFKDAQGVDHEFKYDLRVYFYQNQVHGAVARLYKGQVTNSQTPLGGFAAVEFA